MTELESTRLTLIQEMQDALYQKIAAALARQKGLPASRGEEGLTFELDIEVDGLLSGATRPSSPEIAEIIQHWLALEDEARPLRATRPTK
jgi:hypothetical protein